MLVRFSSFILTKGVKFNIEILTAGKENTTLVNFVHQAGTNEDCNSFVL